ncbi:MAG: arylesterase [Rhodosalinus sp.]
MLTNLSYGPRLREAKALAAALFLLATPATAQEVTLVALGDSLTQGYGLPEDEGFVAQMQDWLDAQDAEVSLVNAGVSGDTTAGGLARVEWSLTDEVDGMIVALGGNDLLRGIDPAVSRTNLRGILEAAEGRDLPVLLVGLEATGNYGPDYKDAFDAMYPDLAAEFGTLYAENFLAPLAKDGDPASARRFLQPDGIHPNPEGVARIVEALGPRVIDLAQAARAADS